MIVGLPTVTLQFPKTLAAWLQLRTFTQMSFEFPEMIRVEAGFLAIFLLVVMLQVCNGFHFVQRGHISSSSVSAWHDVLANSVDAVSVVQSVTSPNVCAGIQVLLFAMVNAEAWPHAFIISYYYGVCLTYGFGTLVVAFNTSREFEGHSHALEEMRMNHVANCYLAWKPFKGDMQERMLAKDICVQAKDVR